MVLIVSGYYKSAPNFFTLQKHSFESAQTFRFSISNLLIIARMVLSILDGFILANKLSIVDKNHLNFWPKISVVQLHPIKCKWQIYTLYTWTNICNIHTKFHSLKDLDVDRFIILTLYKANSRNTWCNTGFFRLNKFCIHSKKKIYTHENET